MGRRNIVVTYLARLANDHDRDFCKFEVKANPQKSVKLIISSLNILNINVRHDKPDQIFVIFENPLIELT